MQNVVQDINPVSAGVVLKVLIDAKEAAAMCGIGRSTWLRNVSAEKAPGPVTLGGRTLWRVQELLDWIAAGCPGRAKWEVMKGTL